MKHFTAARTTVGSTVAGRRFVQRWALAFALSSLGLLATTTTHAQSPCPATADWCGTLTVGTDDGTTIVNYGFTRPGHTNLSYGSLSDPTIEYGDRTWGIDQLRINIRPGLQNFYAATDPALPRGTIITVDGQTLDSEDASEYGTFIVWQIPSGTFDWAIGQQVPVSMRLGNVGSRGKPSISGTHRQYQVLSADTGNISDPDGTTRADLGEPGHAYTYQWERVTNGPAHAIAGATERTYTLRHDDLGKKIQVKVRFHDDRDNHEGPRTSDATASIQSSTNAPPWFQGSGAAIEVLENTAPGTQVGDPFEATDQAGDTVTYTLDPAGEALAEIHPTTGQLTLRADLDYEEKHQHVFHVRATDQHGARAERWASILVRDVEEPPLAPAAPTVTMVEGDYVVLAWTAPGTTGPAITSYNLRYRETGADTWTSVAQRVRATDTMLTGLNPASRYQIQVQATNDEGDSPWSPSASATTLHTRLDPDTTLVNLTVSSGTLSPPFTKRTNGYVVDIDDNVRTLTIMPTLQNEMGFVAYLDENGNPHRDQRPYSGELDLALTAPETTVRVQVTSSDGARSKSYTLTVRRTGRPAKITSVEFFNLPRRGHYEPGDIVDVVVRFDKNVEVTGMPTIDVALGVSRHSSARQTLGYVIAESQTKQLLFRATMDGRNTNTSSVAVIENAIRLNGGAIRTRGTEINADLRYARSFGPPAISQVIKNITITSTPRVPTEKHGSIPTYGPGEIVQFTVHLSQPIVVSGDVVIKVTTPSNRGDAAEYSSGNGSEKLVFEWIVPDDDENLSSRLTISHNLTNAGLQIGSGTFRHTNGTVANPKHERFEFNQWVRAVPPEITGATINGATVTIEYDGFLDTDFVPQPSAFEVQAPDETVSNTVTDVTVTASNTVILTLSAPVRRNNVRDVHYLDDDPVLRDIFGNKAKASTTRANNTTPAHVNIPATGVPVIDGIPQQGQPLTVALSLISDPASGWTNITYRWIEVGAVPDTIESATEQTYHPTADLVGKQLRVEVRFTDGQGHAEGPLTSEATAPVLAPGRRGDLRLVDGPTADSGRLEAFHNSQWGSVCDDRFNGTVKNGILKDHYAPEVACKQLGYGTGRMVARARLGMSMAPLSQPTWLDDVHCSETGSRLAQCNHAGWGLHNCGGMNQDHTEDVHLECFAEGTVHEPVTVEFQDVPTTHSGDEFSFRIAFSEPIDAEGQRLVQNGPIFISGTDSHFISNVDDRRDLWKLTIQPTASEQVHVVIAPRTDCSGYLSICTADERPVSNLEEAIIRFKAKPRLTARFEDVPSSHDGSEADFTIKFSEPIAPGFQLPVSQEVLEITNGILSSITNLNELDPNTYLIVMVLTNGSEDVQATLKGKHACNLQGATCTPDGRRLSERRLGQHCRRA